MPHRVTGFAVCVVLLLATLMPTPAQKQKPGREAGTPGTILLVLDFKSAIEWGADGVAYGRKLADQAVAYLDSTVYRVVRRQVAFSDAELADPNRTQLLKKDLGADVVLGGTVESGVRVGATDRSTKEIIRTKLVATQNARIIKDEKKEVSLHAVVLSVTGSAYVQRGAKEEIPLHWGEQLYIGDRVRCDPGGQLLIRLDDDVVTITPSSGWFPIYPGPRKVEQFWRAVGHLFRNDAEKYAVAVSR